MPKSLDPQAAETAARISEEAKLEEIASGLKKKDEGKGKKATTRGDRKLNAKARMILAIQNDRITDRDQLVNIVKNDPRFSEVPQSSLISSAKEALMEMGCGKTWNTKGGRPRKN